MHSQTPFTPVKHAFTLIELLVVVAIISVLASLLLPALGKARGRARASTCMNNQKELGVAMHLYMEDSDDWYTPAYQNHILLSPNWNRCWTWDDCLSGYDGRTAIPPSQDSSQYRVNFARYSPAPMYRCPEEKSFSVGGDAKRTYAMNSAGVNRGWNDDPNESWGDFVRGISDGTIGSTGLPRTTRETQVGDASSTFLLVEVRGDNGVYYSDTTWIDCNTVSGGPNGSFTSCRGPWYQNKGVLPTWHDGRWNYLYCDGHAALLDPDTTTGGGLTSAPGGGFGQPYLPLGGPWTRDPND